MKNTNLRLVNDSPSSSDMDNQLSLLEWRNTTKLNCVQLDTMHGDQFLRLLEIDKIAFIVDFRRYPFFDFTSLNRHGALEAMKASGKRYFHLEINLGPPQNQQDRWLLRKELVEKLILLQNRINSSCTSGLAFLNSETDISVLEQFSSQIPGWNLRTLRDRSNL